MCCRRVGEGVVGAVVRVGVIVVVRVVECVVGELERELLSQKAILAHQVREFWHHLVTSCGRLSGRYLFW